MLYPAIVGMGFVLLVIQATFAHLLPWDLFVPSLALPIVLYMGLHNYSAAKGALISFMLVYLMDVFAGSPMGLHTFVVVAVFLISRLVSLRLFLQGWFFEVILTFFLALISGILVLSVRAVFDKDIGGLLSHAKIVGFRALSTAVVAPGVYRLMIWLERTLPRRRGGEGRIFRS